MPLEGAVLVRQQEKPNHYNYLKSFRVDQCKEFLQHQCQFHKPYTCFKWHFPNQRRRRPVLNTKDGKFNYSPDQYCNKYDDSNGVCPDGDSCPLLHRNLGDSEHRYHLRYYKTESCSGELDNHGNCSKNGLHCAFAHGPDDKRTPVLDITEQKARSFSGGGSQGGLDGSQGDEKNLAADFDAVWYDEAYLLAHYRTEQCHITGKHNLALCPFFHNAKERRRKINIHKYRPIACPMVKEKDDWLEPWSCDKGDECMYSHTRQELQYHPDIYRTQACFKEQKAGSCNKGIFCPFAHLTPLSKIKSDNQSSPPQQLTSSPTSQLVDSGITNSPPPPSDDHESKNALMDNITNDDSDDSYLSTEPYQVTTTTNLNHQNVSVAAVAVEKNVDVVDASTSTTSLHKSSSGQLPLNGRLQGKVPNLAGQSNQPTGSQSKRGSLVDEIRLDALDDDFEVGKTQAPPPPGFVKRSSQESFELMKLRIELSTLQKSCSDLLVERDDAIKQKNQVVAQMAALRSEPAVDDCKFLRCLHDDSNLNQINLATLFQIQSKLRRDMKIIDKTVERIFYLSSLTSSSSTPPLIEPRCLVCNLYPPCSLNLPCGHKVLCNDCYITETFCPQCSSLTLCSSEF